MNRKAYRSLDVKNIDIERLAQHKPNQLLCVGLDIGKHEIRCVLRWDDQQFERPWKVHNPSQIRLLARLLARLAKVHQLRVALEPTGTYGDPLRQTLHDLGLSLHRVSPKMAHDYAEIFDGVPSQHDGKDAAIIAELAALGRSWPWEFSQPTQDQQELAFRVDWLDAQRRQLIPWQGRIEAVLAKHWPEASRILPRPGATLLQVLAKYGGPTGLAQAEEGLADLRRWSRNRLSQSKAQALLESAQNSVGLRQGSWDVHRMQLYAQEVLAAHKELRQTRQRVKELASSEPVLVAQGEVVGLVTAGVLWVHLGDPRQYSCAAAYRKAMGLNLTERSSGTYQSKLRLSKRGSSQVRRWMYFSALRWLKREPIRDWYQVRKEEQGRPPRSLLTALMRKLSSALYVVGGRGETFDPRRLCPESSEVESGSQ